METHKFKKTQQLSFSEAINWYHFNVLMLCGENTVLSVKNELAPRYNTWKKKKQPKIGKHNWDSRTEKHPSA